MKLIADNLRITKQEIQMALKNFDPRPIQDLVKQCVQKGAFAIDVNTGPLGSSPEKGMAFFIRAVESVTNLPLLIDTSNPAAMAVGLKCAKNRVIINGFSLEPLKLERILPLAKEFNVDIVGFLLYPGSRVPKDEAERCQIVLELFERAEKAGVAKDRVKKNLVVQSYMAMLARAGLDYALLDILNCQTVAFARASGILAQENLFSWEMVPGRGK